MLNQLVPILNIASSISSRWFFSRRSNLVRLNHVEKDGAKVRHLRKLEQFQPCSLQQQIAGQFAYLSNIYFEPRCNPEMWFCSYWLWFILLFIDLGLMLLVLVVGSPSSNSKPSSVVESSWLGTFETNPVGWNMVKLSHVTVTSIYPQLTVSSKKTVTRMKLFFGVTYKSVYPNDGETSLYWHQKSLSTLPRS